MAENPQRRGGVTAPGDDDGGSRRRSIVPLLAAAAALVVAVVVVLLLVGGSDDGDDSGDSGDAQLFPPQVVTDDDIEAQEPSSPERALLQWWQAFQFADSATVKDLTSQETLEEVGADDLAELVRVQGQGLQGVEVLGATESGDSASVRVGLLTFQPESEGEPPPDEPTASTPTTFRMKNEDGEWLFDSPEYLLPKIENLKASQEQQQSDEEQDTQDGSGG